MPAKGSKNHQIEYHDCVDQLYELYQKYKDSHTIIIGGDMNEDLNNPISNKRNQYLLDFIRETQLAQITATPLYPRGILMGNSGSLISTPFAA
jgi:hypothetical protein